MLSRACCGALLAARACNAQPTLKRINAMHTQTPLSALPFLQALFGRWLHVVAAVGGRLPYKAENWKTVVAGECRSPSERRACTALHPGLHSFPLSQAIGVGGSLGPLARHSSSPPTAQSPHPAVLEEGRRKLEAAGLSCGDGAARHLAAYHLAACRSKEAAEGSDNAAVPEPTPRPQQPPPQQQEQPAPQQAAQAQATPAPPVQAPQEAGTAGTATRSRRRATQAAVVAAVQATPEGEAAGDAPGTAVRTRRSAAAAPADQENQEQQEGRQRHSSKPSKRISGGGAAAGAQKAALQPAAAAQPEGGAKRTRR